jgi:hypothetical protein
LRPNVEGIRHLNLGADWAIAGAPTPASAIADTAVAPPTNDRRVRVTTFFMLASHFEFFESCSSILSDRLHSATYTLLYTTSSFPRFEDLENEMAAFGRLKFQPLQFNEGCSKNILAGPTEVAINPIT